MAFTYDTTTDRGVVRLYIGDTDFKNPIFQDAEIDVFISKTDNIDIASGLAILAIASSKARLAIVKKAGNYSEDLKSLAKELREQAKEFFSRGSSQDIWDDFQEIDWNTFSHEERIENKALRK